MPGIDFEELKDQLKELGLDNQLIELDLLRDKLVSAEGNVCDLLCETQKKHEETIHETTLFDERTYVRPCEGCQNDDPLKHNGIYCKIRDWGIFENDHKDKNGKIGKERCDIRFVDIVMKKSK